MEKVLQQQADQLVQQTKHLRELERHASTDNVVQAAQVFTAYKNLKDSDKLVQEINDLTDKIEEGLLDKTGDGLNSNIIKLADYIKKSARGQLPRETTNPQPLNGSTTPPSNGQPVQTTKPNRAADIAAGRDQASKYQMGATGYLKNLFNVKQGETGTKAVGAGIKNMFKLENIFDLSNGKSQGLLGQAVRRQVAKNEFVDTQIATGATANRDLAAKRFEMVNKQRGVASDAQKSIAKYEAQGLSTDQIERTGEYQTIVGAEKKIRTADPLERERRTPAAVIPVKPVAAEADPITTPITAGGNVIPFPLTSRNIPGSTKETESENLRMMQDQTDAIKKIEENTRPLGDIVNFLQNRKPDDKSGGVGSDSSSGSLLDMLPGRGIIRRAGGLLGRAGRGIVNAGRAIATRAAPLLTRAGGAVISGASNLASKAAPILSTVGEVAGGVGSKVAGIASKVAPATGGILKGAGSLLGKAALPLAAGMAIYDGVTGYKDAAENLDIKDREATLGEKLSSAGGSIASGLTFGLLDKKTASKGIASFFGAGPDENKVAPINRTPAMGSKSSQLGKLQAEATNLGLDPNKVTGKFEGGQLTEITDTATGKAYPIAVDPSKQGSVSAAREMRAMNDRSAQLANNAVVPTPQAADQVAGKSAENVAAREQSSTIAPVVINAPQNTSVQQTQNYAPKSPPRNTESSVQQYNRSRFAF